MTMTMAMTMTMTIMRRLGARAMAMALAMTLYGCVVRVRVVDVAIEHPTSVPCMPTWITPQTVPPSWSPSPSPVPPIFCTDTRGCWSTTFAIREVPADASAPGSVGVSGDGDGDGNVTTPKNP